MIRLFTIVFGKQHLEWFDLACSRSLAWPRNREALKAVDAWDVWTTAEDAPAAEKIAAKLGIPVEIHNQMAAQPTTENLLGALMGQMAICRNNAFIFAAPDNIFGDGTIGSLLAIGDVRNICVAVPTLRVASEGFIEGMGSGPLTNPQLVTLAFRHLHRAFAEARAGQEMTSAYRSGVSWRAIGDGLYAVTHRMPSAYLMRPTKGDSKWFKNHRKFGWYDHWFPQVLVEQQRQRVVGSSDAAFIVELTPEHVGRVKLEPEDPEQPDKFVDGDRPHYIVNRNVAAIWRAG